MLAKSLRGGHPHCRRHMDFDNLCWKQQSWIGKTSARAILLGSTRHYGTLQGTNAQCAASVLERTSVEHAASARSASCGTKPSPIQRQQVATAWRGSRNMCAANSAESKHDPVPCTTFNGTVIRLTLQETTEFPPSSPLWNWTLGWKQTALPARRDSRHQQATPQHSPVSLLTN